MVDCPSCKGPVEPDVTGCDWCRVRLARDANGGLVPVFPPIRPGEVILALDFRHVPLPSVKSRSATWGEHGAEPHADGALVTMGRQGMLELPLPILRLRDGCARVELTVLDPAIAVSIMFRKHRIGQADLRYELDVRPDRQDLWLMRTCSTPGDTSATILLPRTPAPSLRPLGQRNAVELRAQGPTLSAVVNDVPVCTVHDSSIGVGLTGLCTSRPAPEAGGPAAGTPTRVLFHAFEVRTVAP